MKHQTIGELVRKLESDDREGTTTISKYVEFNQRENLEKIDAYLNSRHISGETDSKGREKPFFNIVTAATNIWYRATDLDSKHIKIIPTKTSDEISSFLATVQLQDWMRRKKFGQFLNEWGLSLARYGSSILKFVEKDGELYFNVMPWPNMIVDPVDFDSNPKVEKIWLTPAQILKREEYDQELVKKLIHDLETRETSSGEQKDTKDEYIPLYEVHGEMPLSYLTGDDKDDDIYQQQMHVMTFIDKKEEGKEWEDYSLVAGRETRDPYMITHLIKADGRTQSIGAVEHLFQAQWMQNHSAKVIKDNLDLASKLIFQTADGKFIGYNALESIETGDILVHSDNKPLTQIYNRADITAQQSYQEQWKRLGNEIAGISEAMLGAAPKSGTAWRQTEALLKESHDLFELMTENKTLHIKDMLTTYIIPHVKKKMDNTDEIVATLEEHQLEYVDSRFIPTKAIKEIKKKMKNDILSGNIANYVGRDTLRERIDVGTQKITDTLKQFLRSMGNKRSFKPSDVSDETWKEVMKDLEWDLEYEITGESKDTQVMADTLSRVLQFIGNLQGRPMSDEEKLVFNKILSITHAVSPLELSQLGTQQTNEAPVPSAAGGQQVGGLVGTGEEK